MGDIPLDAAYREAQPSPDPKPIEHQVFYPAGRRPEWKHLQTDSSVSPKLHNAVIKMESGSAFELNLHLRVYFLADCHGMIKLKKLAVHKMRQGLLQAGNLGVSQIDTIVSLISDCYNNTSSHTDEMRRLLVLYAAQHRVTLWQHEVFRQLVTDHPDISRDFISASV